MGKGEENEKKNSEMNIENILDTLLTMPEENEVVEFKKAENQFDKDKLGQYFSALSNEANLKGLKNAWMIFGVQNDKSISGTKISDRQINEYKLEIANHTSPKSSFNEVHRVHREEGDVLMLEIPATPRGIPMSWKGHRYGRDGESLGALNDTERRRIEEQITNTDWSAQIIKEADISDLSETAIQKAREEFTKKNPKLTEEILGWSDKIFLNKAKITVKDQITNAAVILLGKPESEYFLTPAVAKITWILKDKENIEKDYEHFSCPFILSVDEVRSKIRNLKYRYMTDTLFPEEVDQFDPYIIREALNNAIAHQDYTLGGKIIVVENEDAVLSFSNSGSFIPESVKYVVIKEIPEEKYRNRFLAEAMVNLNMIDTVGSGIKRMFSIQSKKFFPLPEYDLSNNRVQVTIIGKVKDINFARKLAQMPALTLEEIICLDKVAKNKILDNEELKILKRKKLIEGRKPNFHISSEIANFTEQKDEYMKLRGIENDYIQKIIVDYLTNFQFAFRKDIENVIINKLSESLDITQKRDKIKNNLQAMRRKGLIEVEGKIWKLASKS